MTVQALRTVVSGFLQASRDRFNVPWAKTCWEIEELIGQKGFPALHSNNPMILYAAAGKRTARYDFDYVYGIQQVFGFRLGNSRPGFTQRTYSRSELQVQMGAALINKYPVQSQMHVFSMPVEDGQGWSMSLSSRLPEGPGWEDLRSLFDENTLCSCNIRAEDHPEGGAVGYFDGKKCPSNIFHAAISAHDSAQPFNTQACMNVMIGLDTTRNTEGERPEYRTWGRARDIPAGQEQMKLSSWLVDRHIQKEFILLKLGYATCRIPKSKRHIGLLLLSTKSLIGSLKCWKRIGFVVWNDYHDQRIRVWEDARGYFG